MSSEIHARFRQIRGGMDCASGTFWPFRHSFFSWKEVHRSSSGHSERKWHADQTVSINIVSELLGIFKEHDFLHKLNSLKQLMSLKQLLLNFLHAFAVMGRVCWRKTKVSTWDSFANWLEKEAKISESKQRWMPEKREWRRSDTSKVERRKSADKSQSELFVGATGEALHTSYETKRCPIHQSTNHTLQECKSFKGMLTSEKVKVVEEH